MEGLVVRRLLPDGGELPGAAAAGRAAADLPALAGEPLPGHRAREPTGPHRPRPPIPWSLSSPRAPRPPPPASPAHLHTLLASLQDALVAYSGGIDSTVLLHAAQRALPGRVTALIGDSPSLPRRELADARAFAASLPVPLVVLPTTELASADYVANDGRRCYFCRHTLFTAMTAWAHAHDHTTLLYGEILDDRRDDRPGRRAATELAVRSPLAEAGFTKEDVRRYARAHALPLAEKPAAACLASRLPIGTPVTAGRLARIEDAEERLRDLDLGTLRVRDLGPRARVEVSANALERARSLESELGARLAPLGFRVLELCAYVAPTQRPPANTPSV